MTVNDPVSDPILRYKYIITFLEYIYSNGYLKLTKWRLKASS